MTTLVSLIRFILYTILLLHLDAANPDGSCTNPAFRWFKELDAFYNYSNLMGNNNSIPAERINISLNTPARCLDGSQYFFYLRKGFGEGINKFQIYLQGGGWCSSYQNCYNRGQPNSYLGSSTGYTQYAWYSADYLSDNQSSNPLMYNWNTIWIIYCDGSSFTGNNMTIYPYKVNETYTYNLYFRGHQNLKYGMTMLYEQYGLDTATDVVLSGCSAGGMAVYLNNDYILYNFINPIAAKKFLSIPQSGFFPYHYPNTNKTSWHEGILWIYNTQNVTNNLNTDCIDYYRVIGGPLSNCMFSQYVSQFLIKNKVFALQSIYDTAGMNEQGVNKNNNDDVNEYGQWFANLMIEDFINTNSNLHGALLYSCYSHCGEFNQINVSDILTGNAIQMFYEGNLIVNGGNSLLFQNETYPCNDCCFANYVVPSNITVCKYPNEECDPDCK